MWPQYVGADFAFGNYLIGTVKLTKNIDPKKYSHSGYRIGFDVRGFFSIPDDCRIVKT